MSIDAKQCPWCKRWCLKDDACNYIFACGLQANGVFIIGTGCGRSWCWECGKKFCGQYINPETGQKTTSARDVHDHECCKQEKGLKLEDIQNKCLEQLLDISDIQDFKQEEYCPGGHNSHCPKRW